MGQRGDVAASLMRGDSRDGCARRKVADQVKATVLARSAEVALAAYVGRAEESGDAAAAQAEAASAVVLASDLRAPADGPPLMVTPSRDVDPEIVALAEKFRTENHEPVAEVGQGADRLTADDWDRILSWHSAHDNEGWSEGEDYGLRDKIEALKTGASREPSTFEAVKAIYREAGRDVLRRDGWRARLANVERLLTGPVERETARYGWVHDDLEQAVAEIRAMIDGEGE